MFDATSKKKKRESIGDEVARGATSSGAYAGMNAARAADVVDPGFEAIRKVLQGEANKLNSPDQQWASQQRAQAQGNVFEPLNDVADNIKRAETGKSGTWENSRLNGENRAPYDSELKINGKTVALRQDKLLSGPTTQNLKSIANEKYAGMEIAVPEGEVAQWKAEMLRLADATNDPEARARYEDAAKRIRAGVSRKEVENASTNVDQQQRDYQLKAFGKEVGVTAASAALGATVVGGASSAIRNGIRLAQGDVDAATAATEIAKDTAKGAGRAAGQGALSVTIRTGAEKAGIEILKSGKAAGVAAATMVDVGLVIYSLARDEISAEEAVESLGQTGCTAVASVYAGGATAAVFGKTGTITLTMMGISAPLSVPVLLAATGAGIVMGAVYQSCLCILRSARLGVAEAHRVQALANAAAAELRNQRIEIECQINEVIGRRERALATIFHKLDSGLNDGDASAALLGVSDLANFLGTSLRYDTLEKFCEAMGSEELLVL